MLFALLLGTSSVLFWIFRSQQAARREKLQMRRIPVEREEQHPRSRPYRNYR